MARTYVKLVAFVSGTVFVVMGLIPWPAAGSAGGFQAELLAHLIAPGRVAKGLAAIDRAAEGL